MIQCLEVPTPTLAIQQNLQGCVLADCKENCKTENTVLSNLYFLQSHHQPFRSGALNVSQIVETKLLVITVQSKLRKKN